MDADPSSPIAPAGIAKSNSVSGRSTKSYDSIKVLGGYVLGSLHVVCHDNSPLLGPVADDGEGPPPLDPPARTPKPKRQPQWPKNVMAHYLGGGDAVVALQMPESYTVGYDTVAFTAKTFAGLRNMPQGPHFVWASHPDNSSSRTGFWIMSTPTNRVHVIQWHRDNEAFVQPTHTETRIQAEALDTIFHQLLLYRDPTATARSNGQLAPAQVRANRIMWKQLSGCITQSVLDRVMAEQDGACNVHTGDRVSGSVGLASELDLDCMLRNPIFHCHELKFCFRQQERSYSISTLGHERTVDATDTTSHVLASMNGSRGSLSEEDVVGEYQFAYIVGMYLGNDACIQQWWHITLKVLLKAYRLASCRPKLVAMWLRALRAQLRHSTKWLEGSILDSSESNTKSLRLALTVYKRRLEESLKSCGKDGTTPAHQDVATAFARLRNFVSVGLRWDLGARYLRRGTLMLEDGEEVELDMEDLEAEDERGEWAPEVVELDEEGRQIGLISWAD